jgi:hypothetical protein
MMTTNKRLESKIGVTVLRNEEEAVRDLFNQVTQQDMDSVIFSALLNMTWTNLGTG